MEVDIALPVSHLADTTLVGVKLGNLSSANRWEFKINGRIKNVKVAGDIDANESLALLSLAKQGQGVAFLPEVYVQKELANGTLVEVL